MKTSIITGSLIAVGGMAAIASSSSAATGSGSETLALTTPTSITLVLNQSSVGLTNAGADPLTGQQATGSGSMIVATNNKNGYTVTLATTTANMVGTGGNTDVVPVNTVQWKNGSSSWAATPSTLSTSPQVLVNKATKPALASGDTIVHDFRIPSMPYVNGDTYTTTLNVTATTN